MKILTIFLSSINRYGIKFLFAILFYEILNIHRFRFKDYLVLDPKNFDAVPSPDVIRRICHRNLGIGSDGTLWGPFYQGEMKENFNLRIFNPDGSEAERAETVLESFAAIFGISI